MFATVSECGIPEWQALSTALLLEQAVRVPISLIQPEREWRILPADTPLGEGERQEHRENDGSRAYTALPCLPNAGRAEDTLRMRTLRDGRLVVSSSSSMETDDSVLGKFFF